MKDMMKTVWIAIALGCCSCDKFFDVEPNNILKEDQNYKEYYEVYSSFVGNAVRFQEAAEQYVMVSELMGGMVTPTSNAPVEFWEVFRFQAGNGNSVVDPGVFYRLVINCNDFIRHAFDYEERNPGAIPENTFRGMVSEAIRYRAWAYLTLGKLYGEALYHDYSLSDYVDLSKGGRLLKLDELIDELILSMECGFRDIDGKSALVWRDITNIKGDEWMRFSVNTNALMGELYLWKGDYYTALKLLLNVISGGNGHFVVDASSYADIFNKDITSNLKELVSVIPYNALKQQQNRMQYYFSNISPNVYYLKPAPRLAELYSLQEWKSGAAEGKGDPIRLRANVGVENGDSVVIKYHQGKTPYERDHYIAVYRASEIHLMIAEALNHCGLYDEAMAFLNDGVIQYVTSGGFLRPPFNSPLYNASLVKNVGVRGRVNLKRHVLAEGKTIDGVWQKISTLPAEQQAIIRQQQIDSLILNEYALELPFEGKRWGALVRAGRYWGGSFVVGFMEDKFPSAERAQYDELLSKEENWFIPYDALAE